MVSFRFSARPLHLNYRSHLDHSSLLQWLQFLTGPLAWYSIVWELGTDPGDSTPSPHTHVLLKAMKKLEFSNPDRFDFQISETTAPIHGYIKPVPSPRYSVLVWEYHSKALLRLTQSPSSPLPRAGDLVIRIPDVVSLREPGAVYVLIVDFGL